MIIASHCIALLGQFRRPLLLESFSQSAAIGLFRHGIPTAAVVVPVQLLPWDRPPDLEKASKHSLPSPPVADVSNNSRHCWAFSALNAWSGVFWQSKERKVCRTIVNNRVDRSMYYIHHCYLDNMVFNMVFDTGSTRFLRACSSSLSAAAATAAAGLFLLCCRCPCR